MASFTSVRYASKFPTFNSAYRDINQLPKPKQTLGALLAGAGVGGSPTSFQGFGAPSSSAPAVSPTVAPAAGATPSPQAQDTVTKNAPAFSPPTPDTLSSDPILAQIRALGQQGIQDARSGALSLAERALIGYGSADVPQSLRDLYAKDTSNPIYAALNDQGAAAAAKANPDSTLAQLALEDQRNNAGIDQTTNAQNLYYSSTHANQLGDEATGYRQKQSSAAQSLEQLLGQANQGVLDAQNVAMQQYQGELPNAYQRALDLASLLGGDTTAGDGADYSGGTAPKTGDQAATDYSFAPLTNPFNPLSAILAGVAPSGRNSLLNRYAG
jgi:hypothetical protein